MSVCIPGKITAVLGAQWGDEGKGKLVDILASDADWCCRFNGGSNAGHTLVVNGKKYAFHLLPCGMLVNGVQNLVGAGVVVHLASLCKELDSLIPDFPDCVDRLKLSSRAHLVFDFQRRVDGLSEANRVGAKIGTTGQGIGPTYADKARRLGVRMGDLLRPEAFETHYRALLAEHVARFPEALAGYDAEEELARCLVGENSYAARLSKCVVDHVPLLADALRTGKRVLAEGANAVMLDLDHGTYPFVTSSSTTAGGILTGLGVPPRSVGQTVAVVKAYTTRVGGGAFPSELPEGDAQCVHMQEVGHEYGTTTGRRRRAGWLDAQQLRYALAINGADSLNLTKLDVLTGLSELRIATGYRLDGELLHPECFPADHSDVERVEVEYESLQGWTEDISTCRSISELPASCQAYVRRVEELVGVRVSSIGVGPAREDTIFVSEEAAKKPSKGFCC